MHSVPANYAIWLFLTTGNNYIRQVNEVKLADIMFSLLSVCLSVCAHMAAVFH